MDTDKEVSVPIVSDLAPGAQLDKDIRRPGKTSLKPKSEQPSAKPFSDIQDHAGFLKPAWPDRARIFAAVPGINRDFHFSCYRHRRRSGNNKPDGLTGNHLNIKHPVNRLHTTAQIGICGYVDLS